MGNSIGQGVSSAMEVRQREQQAQIDKERMQQARYETDIRSSQRQIAYNDFVMSNNELYRSNVDNNAWREASAEYARARARRLVAEENAGAETATYTARRAHHDDEFEQTFKGRDRWIERGADTIGAAIGGLVPTRRMFRGGGGQSALSAARREPYLAQPGIQPPRGGRTPDIIDPSTGEILRKGRNFKRSKE